MYIYMSLCVYIYIYVSMCLCVCVMSFLYQNFNSLKTLFKMKCIS